LYLDFQQLQAIVSVGMEENPWRSSSFLPLELLLILVSNARNPIDE
jgi:hypothetical protein